MTKVCLMVTVATLACGKGSRGQDTPEALADGVVAAILARDSAACQAFGTSPKERGAEHRKSCDECVSLVDGAKRADPALRCLLPPSSPTRVFDCSLMVRRGEPSLDGPAPTWFNIRVAAGDFGAGGYRMINVGCEPNP